MRTSLSIRIALAALFVTILWSGDIEAQEIITVQPICDSLVTEDNAGSREVSYLYKALPAVISGPDTAIHKTRNYILSEVDPFKNSEVTHPGRVSPVQQISSPSIENYSVGSIPIYESVSPTGARIYNIPIHAVQGWKLSPTIYLTYNSQTGNGIGGYGWGISGLSSIEIRNKNYYYDEKYQASIYDSSEAEYSLDGAPIVKSSLGLSGYSYSTHTGNIQIKKHLTTSGATAYFSVLYPNGTKGTFGYENNNIPRNSYPLTKLVDIQGNEITFTYQLIGNIYYITRIDYGANASTSFTWANRTEGAIYRFASSGNYITHPSRLLKNITCKDGENEVLKYTLNHEVKDEVSLLTSIECTSSSQNLSPLIFQYGIDTDTYEPSHVFRKEDESLYLKFFNKSENLSLIYKRGKLMPGNQNDGIVVLPSYETYAQIGYTHKWYEFHRSYKYGSKYAADQEILCNLSGYYSTTQKIILAEEGFQLIEALDVNGDGTDELVKINSSSISQGVTNYKITIFSFDRYGNMTNQAFTISVNDGTYNKYYTNPAKSFYKFGDFRGDGKSMLLIVTRDASKFALVDLNNRNKVSESSLFSMSDDEINLVISADFENDGQADLCHVTDNGMDIYSLSALNGTTFSLRTTYSGISKYDLYKEPIYTYNGIPKAIPAKLYILDINGDGYLDVAAAPSLNMKIEDDFVIDSNTWNISRFNGKNFYTETISLFNRSEDDTIIFLDVDKDGLPDMLQLHNSHLFYIPNKNGNFTIQYNYSEVTLDENSDLIPGDLSIFGTAGDIIVVSGAFVRLYVFGINHTTNRLLLRMTDSYGNVNLNSFGKITESDGSYFTDYSRSYSTNAGYMPIRIPLVVLSGIQTYDSQWSLIDNRFFTYWDAIYHKRGMRFCGFGKIRTSDYVSNVFSTSILDPEKFGVIIEISLAKSYNGSPYSIVTNTYDNNSTTYGKLNPRLTKSVENNTLTGVETTTSYTYGSYDLPTTILTSRRIGTGTAQTEKLVRTYENSVSTSKYVLGVVKEESVVKEGDGSATLAWKERSVNTYDSYYRPLTNRLYVGRYGTIVNRPIIHPIRDSLILNGNAVGTIIDEPIILDPEPVDPEDPEDPGEPGIPIEPSVPIDTAIVHPFEPIGDIEHYDATNLVSETQWLYDSWGNVISEKSASYGAAEYVGNTYTYDSDGRYMLSKTDALGHTTTYSGYNKFGKPATVKDYRNRTTTYTYDAWGNLVTTTLSDGTVEQTTAAWGGAGLYTVTSTATGKPETVIHYDALGREIRSGVKRFDGQWQWTDREYDSKGRLSRTSLPYRGTTAAYWSTYAYDEYNRPVSLTEASGKTSTWSYSGTSITTVKDGITSTSTTDASGNVVSVTDAGGIITYVLRDDGQPSKITAPGNVSTTFTYDDYGRRTKIVDPSAGTQTDAYVWNADGSSAYTHTNANGTVKTYKDKYGRTTLVERPGEYNTTYTYDTYGRLSTEQSTNGTGMEYTYDGLDRVVTSKETIPDGKWLQKAYTYTNGSVLSGIAYTCQDGAITTETYTYSNGHNTGITLPDGTVVWSLASENELGMPTEIETGDITREYGYTAFGMPTYRRMDGSDLQDFTYSFDVATGNLLSRSDGVNGQTETFGYDNLNRLVAIGSRQISYDSKGNILSMDGVGAMTYGSSLHPYRITTLAPEEAGLVPDRQQIISYTCYNRPSVLTEGGRSAAFTYNGDGGRVKMYVADGATPVLSRYYIGGRYEYDQTPSGNKERLYLGGDAYSAPMVYQRENAGNWTAYNIGRDYLGNVTQIASLSGTLVAEYSYDPWGRLRNPETLEIYSSGCEPELFLGRGFTGHEHLTWFGLVNMNARLYDPLLGRFLSPDPYVQAPDFTQNFNRYSYALNNPLKYTDESGEFVISALLISIGVGAIVNVAFNWNNIDNVWEGMVVACVGAGAGALAVLTGGSSIGVQMLAGLGVGAVNSATNNAVKQLGDSGNGSFDWGEVGRSAVSGAFTGAATAGANNIINGGGISNILDKMKIDNYLWRNIVGNSIEGAITGLIAGAANGIGGQFVKNGFEQKWDWTQIGVSALFGVAIGGAMGAANGFITEGIYQAQRKYGYEKYFRSSDFAEAVGERVGDIAANLEASGVGSLWPWGHDYANRAIELAGSICIGILSGRCTISIDPYAPMIPSVPTYYVPKP